MQHLIYLAAIILSMAGMAFLDWRYRLALFSDVRRTLLCVGIGLLVFIAWDAAGIGLDIFYAGDAPYVTGIMLAPEFPLEEFFFLTFLCYFSLVVYRFWEVVLCKRT
jgi:lycopene cyclase domain-containing protein